MSDNPHLEKYRSKKTNLKTCIIFLAYLVFDNPYRKYIIQKKKVKSKLRASVPFLGSFYNNKKSPDIQKLRKVWSLA